MFPSATLYSSIVIVYKVSNDLFIVWLLFCEFELHEHGNVTPREEGLTFVVENKRPKKKEKKVASSESKSKIESEGDFHQVRCSSFCEENDEEKPEIRQQERQKKYSRIPKRKVHLNLKSKSKVTCYDCNKKGHYKTECLKLQNKEENINLIWQCGVVARIRQCGTTI